MGGAASIGSGVGIKFGTKAGVRAGAGARAEVKEGVGAGRRTGSVEEHKCASCGFIQKVNVDQINLDQSGEMNLICSQCGLKMPSTLSIALKLLCIACGESYEEGDCCSGCGGLSMRKTCEVTCVGCGSVEQIEQNRMRMNAGGLMVARCTGCTQIRLVKGINSCLFSDGKCFVA